MAKRRRPEDDEDLEAWNREDASDLDRPEDLKKYDIVVASRDWTVETVAKQIHDGNIDLDPAFQRRNAWKDPRRSRLIESLILGFPVPQLVLAEDPKRKGTFVVIDGKQRLMTIAGLFLKAYRDYWTEARFAGLEVLTDLNGVEFKTFLSAKQFARERTQLENGSIRTTVLTGFSDEEVLYDIFYRINTGSVPLSSQELRQALHRGSFSLALLRATETDNPLWTLLGIDRPDARLRDVELLLRLISLRRRASSYKGSMKEFLDSTMEGLNSSWVQDKASVEILMKELFAAVRAAIEIFGEQVGRKREGDRYERRLNRALFEVQAYYLSIPRVRTAALRQKAAVRDANAALFRNNKFMRSIETTTKSVENYRVRFEQYRRMLSETLKIETDRVKIGA